jgi:serine protease Do
VQRVALGVTVRDAGANDAAYVGLPDIRGVRVEDVGDDSPARKAGLEAGDIIIAVDDRPVAYVGQLQQQIAFRQPGDVVKVEVARKGGVRKTYDVRLEVVAQPAEKPSDEEENQGTVEHAGTASIAPLGISVAPLTPDLAQEYQLETDLKGLLVTELNPGGPAWERLAAPSNGGPDVILSVENIPVKTVADFRKALEQQGKNAIVTLRVYNGRLQNKRIERVQLSDSSGN